jgi:hypothetical protein
MMPTEFSILSAAMRAPLMTAGLIALLFAAQGRAAAHQGAEPLLEVPLDHVLAGQPFPVFAADMGPSVSVSFSLIHDQRVARLGTVTAGADGHFETTLVLPTDFPDGYAQLVASGSDGLDAATWILVGDGVAEAAAPPGATSGSDWWRDPSVLVLALILGASGLALAVAVVRSTRNRGLTTGPGAGNTGSTGQRPRKRRR